MDDFKDFLLYLDKYWGLNILCIQQKKHSDSAWFYDCSDVIRLKNLANLLFQSQTSVVIDEHWYFTYNSNSYTWI